MGCALFRFQEYFQRGCPIRPRASTCEYVSSLVSRGTGYSTVLEGWNAARIKHDDGSGWFGIVTVHVICHSAFVTFANAFNRDKFSRQWTPH